MARSSSPQARPCRWRSPRPWRWPRCTRPSCPPPRPVPPPGRLPAARCAAGHRRGAGAAGDRAPAAGASLRRAGEHHRQDRADDGRLATAETALQDARKEEARTARAEAATARRELATATRTGKGLATATRRADRAAAKLADLVYAARQAEA